MARSYPIKSNIFSFQQRLRALTHQRRRRRPGEGHFLIFKRHFVHKESGENRTRPLFFCSLVSLFLSLFFASIPPVLCVSSLVGIVPELSGQTHLFSPLHFSVYFAFIFSRSSVFHPLSSFSRSPSSFSLCVLSPCAQNV